MGEDHIPTIPCRFMRDKDFLLCGQKDGQKDNAILNRGRHEEVNANNHLAIAVSLNHIMGVIEVGMLIEQCFSCVAP